MRTGSHAEAGARRPVLPRGRHAAPRHVVEQSQRGRLLEAMAAAVGEQGYVNTSVADALSRAGVSRKSFYEHFANKQQCFLAAYEVVCETLMGAIEEAVANEPDPIAATLTGSRTYLEWIGEHPSFARAFFVEVLAAGPEALALRAALHDRFVDLLQSNHARLRAAMPELPADVPRHRFVATVGALNELVQEQLRRHGTIDAGALLDPVVDVQLHLLAGTAPQLPR